MDARVVNEWADAWWLRRAPELEEELAGRIAALDRLGLLTAAGMRDYVVETRGSVDRRVAYELVKQALPAERPAGSSAAPRPSAPRSTPGPSPRPRPKAPAGRAAEPGPALRVVGRQLRDDNLLVRFGFQGTMDSVFEEVEAGELDGHVIVRTSDIEDAGGDGYLPVLYGARSEGPDTTRDLGRRVAATLRQAGLTVDWSDDPSLAIMVVLPWAPLQPAPLPVASPAPAPSPHP